MTVTGISPLDTLYLALRSRNASGNWSSISNAVQRIPRPGRYDPTQAIACFAWCQSDPNRNLDGVTAALHPDFRFHFTTQDAQNS